MKVFSFCQFFFVLHWLTFTWRVKVVLHEQDQTNTHIRDFYMMLLKLNNTSKLYTKVNKAGCQWPLNSAHHWQPKDYRQTGGTPEGVGDTFTMDREATVMHCTWITKSRVTLHVFLRPFIMKFFKKFAFNLCCRQFHTNTAVLTFYAHYGKLSLPFMSGHLFVLASICLWWLRATFFGQVPSHYHQACNHF